MSKAVKKLRGRKAAGMCNLSTIMLRARGKEKGARVNRLHAMLSAVWQSGNTRNW